MKRLRKSALATLVLMISTLSIAQQSDQSSERPVSLKQLPKTIGERFASRFRFSSPLPISGAAIVVINGAHKGRLVPVVRGEEMILELETRDPTTKKKNKEFVPVVLGPGDQITLVSRSAVRYLSPLSVVLKYYSDDGLFIGATEPREWNIPQSGSISDTWVFRLSDLRDSTSK